MGLKAFFKKKRVKEDHYDDYDHYDMYEDIHTFDVYADEDIVVGEELSDKEEAVNNKRRLEQVNINVYDEKELSVYVSGQCEIIKDAVNNIDIFMAEYNNITERFDDIELLENAPKNLQKQIADAAEEVDNLEVDRHIFRSTENKLSNNAYRRMERYEEEIPKAYRFIKEQEEHFEAVKHDLQMLEGEKMALRLEARNLKKRQNKIKSMTVTMFACLIAVFSVFTIAIIAMDEDENISLFFLVTILGAAFALAMFAILKSTQRQVKVTEIKLNKAIGLINKTRIKFVNATNVLDFEYEKFKIKNSDELGRKYELYLEMKEDQKQIVNMTSRLNEAQEVLLDRLRRIGMKDPYFWMTEVKALYNRKEMVEVRHDFTMERQKLRSKIEYNENEINNAKASIRVVNQKHPEFTDTTIKILDEYEKNTRI